MVQDNNIGQRAFSFVRKFGQRASRLVHLRLEEFHAFGIFITVAVVSATANPAVVTTASETNITKKAVLFDTFRRFCTDPIMWSTKGVIAMAALKRSGLRNCCASARPATRARNPPHCPAAKGVKPASQPHVSPHHHYKFVTCWEASADSQDCCWHTSIWKHMIPYE